MQRVGNGWLITDVGEFWQHCAFAEKVVDFADEQAKLDGLRWYFKECYANWDANSHTTIFGSYVVPPYDKYLLSVNATLRGNEWNVTIVKKVTGQAS